MQGDVWERMKSWIERFAFHSIEISSKVLCQQQQQHALQLSSPFITHYLLPDFSNITEELKEKYFSAFKAPCDRRIITISALKFMRKAHK